MVMKSGKQHLPEFPPRNEDKRRLMAIVLPRDKYGQIMYQEKTTVTSLIMLPLDSSIKGQEFMPRKQIQ